METFELNRDLAQLAILQRTELISSKLKKIRKTFGRFLFSKIFSKYFIDIKIISKKYFEVMQIEFKTIQKYLFNQQNILSIGSGIGGLEVLINNAFNDSKYTFIERNFISKKVRYGWDKNNNEGYNYLNLLKEFLVLNKFDNEKFQIVDYDNDVLPIKKFDLITSLYSLDFHYDFNLYKNYLKKVSDNNTVIIFDTVRADYFKNIFKNVDVIRVDDNTVHKSKRIACKIFRE